MKNKKNGKVIAVKPLHIALNAKDYNALQLMSSQLGIPVSTLTKLLIKHGIHEHIGKDDVFESDTKLLEAMSLFKRLTARELEIIDLMARGLSNKAIADRLKIGLKTVKNSITSILRKLNVKNRMQAVIVAEKYKLILTDISQDN